jgi:hypothetical protein
MLVSDVSEFLMAWYISAAGYNEKLPGMTKKPPQKQVWGGCG